MLGRWILAALLTGLHATENTEHTERQRDAVEPLLVAAAYAGPRVRPPRTALDDVEVLRRDLGRIRQSGYNSIVTWIPWPEAERQKGTVSIDGATTLIAVAAALDLQVIVRVLTSPAPAWAKGDAAAATRFVDSIRSRLNGMPGVAGIEVNASRDVADIDLITGPSGFARNRLAFWTAIARGEKRVSFTDPAGGAGSDLIAFGETAGVVSRNEALFAPLKPREKGIREVSGGGGAPVEVRLLESRDGLMIIALNRAPAPHKVRITFDADIPEAIWQNMETGATVNLVMTEAGPVLETTFAAHDAIVLTTSRKLR